MVVCTAVCTHWEDPFSNLELALVPGCDVLFGPANRERTASDNEERIIYGVSCCRRDLEIVRTQEGRAPHSVRKIAASYRLSRSHASWLLGFRRFGTKNPMRTQPLFGGV